ncbi:hypothetical protein Smic_31410 [Streptomyces microflavus]|uniref:Uncharacterized protein n=1 Tax=Streptomyces microflavus TaxID=1919 RepID=A0A7J0CSB8_STRMI|nr:hypothetical protein Smic_31410 [Streptomyces microflavus]
MAWSGGTEGAFAAVAGLEGRDGVAAGRWWREVVGAGEGWWEEDGEAVFDELVGVVDGLRRVDGEGVADGVGVGVTFEPGRDSGDELPDVFLGEGELGRVVA